MLSLTGSTGCANIDASLRRFMTRKVLRQCLYCAWVIGLEKFLDENDEVVVVVVLVAVVKDEVTLGESKEGGTSGTEVDSVCSFFSCVSEA